MENSSEIKKLERWYDQEIRRKDRIIKELRKENELILKTALEQSKKTEELKERISHSQGHKQDE